MEIVFSSSSTSFGAPLVVDIDESSAEPEAGNSERDKSQILPQAPKLDSSILTVCRNMLLSGFGSTANVSLNPPQYAFDAIEMTMSDPDEFRFASSFDLTCESRQAWSSPRMSSTMSVMSDPTSSRCDDNNRCASKSPCSARQFPHQQRRPVAVAVGFDQLEDSDGRTVVIVPDIRVETTTKSPRVAWTPSQTCHSVAHSYRYSRHGPPFRGPSDLSLPLFPELPMERCGSTIQEE